MIGFVDRLVARGAGLSLPERAATLRLRPVSPFEAGPAEPRSAGWVDPVINDGPRISSNPAQPEQYEPAARRVAAADPSPPSFEAHEPVREETISPRPVQQTERRNHPLDVSVNRHNVTREQAAATERRPDPAVEPSPPVRSSVDDNVKIQARPVAEEPAFLEASAYQHRDSIADAIPSPAEITSEAPTPAWSERPSFATAETQAPVTTVTVNRIDVQFLQPPAAPPAPPSAPRSHGFDAYARARRGIPR